MASSMEDLPPTDSIAALVANGLHDFSGGDLMQASAKLSEAFSIEVQNLHDHQMRSFVGAAEAMPDWMEGDYYIASRESGFFAVLSSRLELATELIKASPAHAVGYLQRASVLCVLNRWAEARKTYNEGLMKCRETDQLQEALSLLDAVEAGVSRAELAARAELHGQRTKSASFTSSVSARSSSSHTLGPLLTGGNSPKTLCCRSLSMPLSEGRNRLQTFSSNTSGSMSGPSSPRGSSSTLSFFSRRLT